MSLRDDYKRLRDNPAWQHLLSEVTDDTMRKMHALNYDDPARLGHSHVLSLLDRMKKKVGAQAAGKDKVTIWHESLKEAAI